MYSEEVNNLEFKKISEHNYDLNTMPWQIECKKMFDELGFDECNYKFQMLPFFKLNKLKDKYFEQSMVLDEYGHFIPKTPIFNYVPKTNIPEKELYSLGRILGLVGDLGKYYLLLTDINFSRGFWLGSVEKAIIDDDSEKMKSIRDDIEIILPNSSDVEFNLIRRTMFSDK